MRDISPKDHRTVTHVQVQQDKVTGTTAITAVAPDGRRFHAKGGTLAEAHQAVRVEAAEHGYEVVA